MSHFYLGVDGGQSSTVALIADENGLVVGNAAAGPCNHVTGPERRAKFLHVLGECLREATRDLPFPSGTLEFRAACLGFSGGAEDKAECVRELISSAALKVTHDAEIALAGATGGEPGIIVIAGTGSIAFGRNAEGRCSRAGGWGYVFGDEGGGFDITRRALRAALQFEEGWGPETVLHAKLLSATGARSANELLHRFYADMPRRTVAALACVVSESAEGQDSVAHRILAEAANALTWYVQGVYHRLFQNYERVPVAYVGGVFQSAVVREVFSEQIRTTVGCQAQVPLLPPAAGALLEAFRLDARRVQLSGIPQMKT